MINDQTYYSEIEGNTFELSVPAGCQLRADWKDASNTTQTATATAADGMLSFDPPAVGRYYLATRASATDPWERLGVLTVEALVDESREHLIARIVDLRKRVEQLQAIQYQVSDPSGMSVTRVTLGRLREELSIAETRLERYDRVMAGRPPVRFS